MTSRRNSGERPELRSSHAFGVDTREVASARRFVTTTLTGWRCDGAIEDAELIASELVTNAILHSGSAGSLTLTLRPGVLRVAVTDHGEGTPRVMSPSTDRAGGRGLLIVTEIAESWGIDPAEPGKTTWAEIRTA